MDLATVGGVDLVLVLDPAEAGEVAVVVKVLVGVGIGDRSAAARSDVGDDGGGAGADVVAGEAVVVLAELLALAGGAGLRADPEGVVVGEEDLGVVAVGDGDGRAGDHGGEIEQGEPAGEEAVGLELLACEVEGGSIGDRCGGAAGDGYAAGDGCGVRRGVDVDGE